MVIYSIREIEEITGIKAHTLRIWEKRYNIVSPHRTKTNIRYYTEKELKEILNISFLNKNGFKISQIAKMSADEIELEVAKLTHTDSQVDKQLDALSIAVINMDEKTIHIILDKYIEQIGFREAMDIVINPFLEKLSVLWVAGSVKSVHESFISEILKHKTIQAIHNLKMDSPSQHSVMLYLGEKEKQELSILFLIYLLKSKGVKTKLVGCDLTIKDVLDAYSIFRPDYIYTIINEDHDDGSFDAYIEYVCKTIDQSEFIISGMRASHTGLKLPINCKVINDLDSVVEYLAAGANANQGQKKTS